MTHEPSDPQGHANESDLCGVVLLGRYKVLERLGKGGMGTVYLGEHVTIGKKFAIKVLGAEFARRADLVQRFLQEARAASMITQQNVVEISDFGDTPDGSVFFVMEYLDGEDLGATLQRERRLSWERTRHMMVQVCRALEAAHAEGIVHRDMKPDNCFRITRGKDPDFIKVLDFGIAKVQSGESSGGKGLTQTGMVFGTPEYMAPEQAEGAAVDHRVDVYAVGVIMYELLCGRVPFSGTTFMGILTKHMFEVPEAPSAVSPEAEIPAEAEAIVLKAMQKDPKLRFANMAELIEAMEAVGTGAAPVEVVRESIARPAKGPTVFARRGTTEPASGEETRAGGRSRLWLGLGAVGLLAAAVVIGVNLVEGEDPLEEPRAAQVQVAPTAPEQETPAVVATPAPEPAPTPAAPAVVELHFATNVPAQILDARDQAIFGNSGDAEGIELERSEQPVQLLLRAEGYEPLTVEVIPNKDKRYEFELVESERRRPAERPRPSVSSERPAPEPEGVPLPEPERPSHEQDGDLKNPFAR